VVAWYRQFNVSGMAGTLRCLEAAGRAGVVAELAQLGGVEAGGHGVEQGVEGEGRGHALGREGADVLRAEEAKVHALDEGGDGLRGIHRVGYCSIIIATAWSMLL